MTKAMAKLFLVALLVSFLGLVFGCSIPEGGFVEPTVEAMVHYSGIVAVGTVTEITEDPSYWGTVEGVETYGARVVIWCTYKGGPLPRTISIGEAGYIPGMCFSYDLELNKEYILFLHHYPAEGYYTQVDSALPMSKLDELKNVCALNLTYPTGPGIGFEACPNPTNSPDCLQYHEPSWQVDWESWESVEEEEEKK